MKLRGRLLAVLGLAVQCAASIGLPGLHLWHHSNNHHHGADGATYWDGAATSDAADRFAGDVEAQHQDFDSDMLAIELSDAAHFGIASVDCELASYTLALCPDPAGPTAPPHTFGDEFLARQPHHHHPSNDPFDPLHGAHSLEHFGLALIGTPIYLLPPPAAPVARILSAKPIARPGHDLALALRARGPPSSLRC